MGSVRCCGGIPCSKLSNILIGATTVVLLFSMAVTVITQALNNLFHRRGKHLKAGLANLLQQLGMMERAFGLLPMPVACLRAGWFMENAVLDLEPALASGVIPSFLYPLDKPVPMVATADVGRMAASLLRQNWTDHRIVELEGPRRTTPNEVAEVFSRLLGKAVRMEPVARDTWESLFASQGMKNPLPRIQMLEGFNEGWIEFEFPTSTVKGSVPLETVLRGLVQRMCQTV